MGRVLGELAELVGGEILGSSNVEIADVAPLAEARPDELSFLANPKYREQAIASQAGAILLAAPIEEIRAAQVICDNPYLAMAQIAGHLHPPRRFAPGVQPGAHVDPRATVDETAHVAAGAVVGEDAEIAAHSVVGANCVVGPGARLEAHAFMHPGSKLLDRCILGERSILQAGAVVGSDGFGYAPDAQGKRVKIPQVGIVLIEADVEIGANTTIDRATFGRTVIGRGSKIDNLVQIAHNVRTGEDCVIVAQSGIAGSTTLGDRVIMGAQTGSVGHVHLASGVTLAARAAAASHLSEGIYGGVPAVPHRDWLKFTATLPKLPELRRRVRELERRLDSLGEDQED